MNQNQELSRLRLRMVFPAFLLLPIPASELHAEPRTSRDYAVRSDTNDAGGGRSTSSVCTNDGSIGGMVGISTVVAPVVSDPMVRAGYIGQLFEVDALQLVATPTSLGEGETRQLEAKQLLDDDTTLQLDPAAVTWSILGGPLVEIGPDGLARAGNVYEDTEATVTGSYEGENSQLGLTVVNLISDDFGSYANDGIDDDWQVLYFGEENTNAGPAEDPDGDGQDNLFEFIAGTIPTDIDSRFEQWIERGPINSGQVSLMFSPRLVDRVYTVQTATNLTSPEWSALTGAVISDDGELRIVTDPDTAGSPKFYHIVIEQQ